MPFQPGNREFEKRKINTGGRPTKEQADAWQLARQRMRRKLAKDADGIYRDWRSWVGEDPATARHAMDKILGDGEENTGGGQTLNVFIGIQQSGSTPELRANGLQIHLNGHNGQNGNGSDGA